MTTFKFELVRETDLVVLRTRRIKAGHEETAWRRIYSIGKEEPSCFWFLADVY